MRELRKLLLATCTILILFTACKKPRSFDYRGVKNIKVQQLGFDKSKLSMDLIYFNPNGFGVNLRKVDCDIFVDNNYLGKYTLDTTLYIDKRSEFVLPSNMNVDMRNVYKNIFNVLFSKEITVRLKGTTRVGKGGIYLTIPIDFETKQKFTMM